MSDYITLQLKTRRGLLFLPPSDACVRSFLYLLYTLIKLYYTKALSDPASSLAPDWIRLLQRPRISASYHLATTFQYHTKKFLHSKGKEINQMKRWPLDREKIFANHVSKGGYYLKYIRNSQNSIARKPTNNPIKNGQRTSRDTFSKEDIQMANKYMKNAQYHYSSGKCKSKSQ